MMSYRLKELYDTLDELQQSGKDVVYEIEKEVNNIELECLQDSIIPDAAQQFVDKLKTLKCKVEISLQYDGNGKVRYSFCKSGSMVLVQNEVLAKDNVLSDRPQTQGLCDFAITGLYDEIRTKKHKLGQLKVTYNNGEIITGKNSTTTFIKVISDHHPELIREIGIKHSGINLIMDRPAQNGLDKRQRCLAPKWFVFVNLNTKQKAEDLRKISQSLGADYVVEIIPNESDHEIHTKSEHSSCSAPRKNQSLYSLIEEFDSKRRYYNNVSSKEDSNDNISILANPSQKTPSIEGFRSFMSSLNSSTTKRKLTPSSINVYSSGTKSNYLRHFIYRYNVSGDLFQITDSNIIDNLIANVNDDITMSNRTSKVPLYILKLYQQYIQSLKEPV